MENKNSSFFDTVANAMSNFIGVFKKHGIAVSTYCTLLLIVVYSFVINPINIQKVVDQLKVKQTDSHVESVNKRLMADQLVPPILENMRLHYDLDRVCLLEKHNSTENINKVSFLYISMVYEQYDFANDMILPISDYFQNQRTSEYFDIFQEIEKNGYLYIENIENYKDAFAIRFVRKMQYSGVSSVLLVPLIHNGNIDALLMFASHESTLDIHRIMTGIYRHKDKIKTLIF